MFFVIGGLSVVLRSGQYTLPLFQSILSKIDIHSYLLLYVPGLRLVARLPCLNEPLKHIDGKDDMGICTRTTGVSTSEHEMSRIHQTST